MIRISSGSEGPKPGLPRWYWWLLFNRNRLFWWSLVGLTVLGAWAGYASAGIVNGGPSRVCDALNRPEDCDWTIVRTMKFQVSVVVNDATHQQTWLLTRGRSMLGSGPFPSAFGTVTEDSLRGVNLLAATAYATGDAATRAALLALAHLDSGVPYVRDLYAIQIERQPGLGTTLTAKVKIAIAQ